MDMLTSLAGSISQMKAAETAYEANVKVMKSALDVQKQTGNSLISLLEGGEVNKAEKGASTGSSIDVLA
ncbi:putative motility protein [Deferribacteres bacterium DY0037]|uniref:putative motility protein n=1 Tax=Denitrovibrio acetiphilus TaxID=118000 RepID=UPI00019B3DAD|nr:putative motility protein [Denitrovibrio acetiphilus]